MADGGVFVRGISETAEQRPLANCQRWLNTVDKALNMFTSNGFCQRESNLSSKTK